MIALKICKIEKKDAGKGFARLNSGDMREIGVEAWDLVEIGGKRKTIVRVMPLDKSKSKKSIIELDDVTRENARVEIDEHVFVKKIDSKSAKWIASDAIRELTSEKVKQRLDRQKN